MKIGDSQGFFGMLNPHGDSPDDYKNAGHILRCFRDQASLQDAPEGCQGGGMLGRDAPRASH